MDTTEDAVPATPAAEVPPGSGAGTGFMLGLFGYLVAVVVFGYVGIFTGQADPGDQLAIGLAAAYLVVLAASVAVPVAVVRLRRRRPKLAAGLFAGMAVGVVLVVLLSVRVFGVMAEVASTCPCEPIIDQVRLTGD